MTANNTAVYSGGNYIHYNPERVDYTISDGELAELERCSDNAWKEFCLLCVGLGFPCVVNAVILALKTDPFVPTLDFNLNLVFGLVGLILGGAFGVAWRRTKRSSRNIMAAIKAKPKLRLPDGATE